MDKKNIMRNFSRYAHTYDQYAQVQDKAASALLNQIPGNGFQHILEIGCGTGNYTLKLSEKFHKAKIKAFDISQEMLIVAQEKLKDKQIGFILADAEKLNLIEDFDLITSNACFQWLENVADILIQYKTLLRKDGRIAFSIFGPRTLWQLNEVLERYFQKPSLVARGFLTKNQISNFMKKNFKAIKVKEINYSEDFVTVGGLFKKIKYTGIRGSGLNGNNSLTRGDIAALNKIYLDRFGKIQATYQVFFCVGVN